MTCFLKWFGSPVLAAVPASVIAHDGLLHPTVGDGGVAAIDLGQRMPGLLKNEMSPGADEMSNGDSVASERMTLPDGGSRGFVVGDKLSWHGFGELRVGMSRNAFRPAGFALEPAGEDAAYDPSQPHFNWQGCVERPLRGVPSMQAMFEDGLLIRLVVTDPAIATRAGGASACALRRCIVRMRGS